MRVFLSLIQISEHVVLEAKQLAQRPRLERATAWRVRRLGVANLRDMAESRLLEMPIQRWEETVARFFFSRVSVTADAQPCLNKGTDEPRPHRPLMITAIALRDASAVMCRVARFALCERTQTDWRKQTRLYRIHDSARFATGEHLQRQAADSEDLVWAKR